MSKYVVDLEIAKKLKKNILIIVFMIFLFGCTSTYEETKPICQKSNYKFSKRGCVLVEGSDNILGVGFILQEGYCVELNKEDLLK